MGVEPFLIYTLTLKDGGRIGISRLPGRSGQLAGDVAKIATWNAACVVSLTQEDEMNRKGGSGLAEMLGQARIPWQSFAITDYGAPQKLDQRWPALAASLHDMLDHGHGVLLHCAGGQGRSGMVAMRLMVERGLSADEALAAIRAVRPGAVETMQQREWGAAGRR